MRTLYQLDSITQITADMGASVIVSGSHGGVSSASYVVNAPNMPFAVFFNDAGVGKDAAGIEALSILNQLGIMAFAYSHESARIGQAADGLQSGVVSFANACAQPAYGQWIGCAVRDLVKQLRQTDRYPMRG